jgi:polyhydroxyalkanoate synthase
MNQEIYLSSTSEKKLGKDHGTSGETDTNSVLKEIGELARKLDKTRGVLHNAGNVTVGGTPHEIVDETSLYRLLHYRPMVSKTAKTPILFVYALINRSYILDLQRNKSWIRSLLAQGLDIYLVDWKTPSQADKYVSFDDYIIVT